MVVGLFSHCNLKYFDILDIFATGLLMLYNLQYLLQMVIKLTFLLEMIHLEMWVDINVSLMNAERKAYEQSHSIILLFNLLLVNGF